MSMSISIYFGQTLWIARVARDELRESLEAVVDRGVGERCTHTRNPLHNRKSLEFRVDSIYRDLTEKNRM